MRRSEWQTLGRVLANDLAPRTASESVVLSDRPHARLLRLGTADQFAAAREAGTVPVLLVPPLAVPARCYDLAPGVEPANSVVEFLLSIGTVPYLVDFGDVSRADRDLGFEDFFETIVPQAISEVVDDFAAGPASVDLMAWSLGGTISYMTAAYNHDLPIRSISTVGTPLDYMKIPPYPIVRKLLGPTGGRPANYVLDALAGIPAPIVRLVYRGLAFERELRKPMYILKNLDNQDALVRMQVIDRFQNELPGYPGRVAQQMLQNFVLRGELERGVLHFDNHTVDLTTVTAPLLMTGSHRDNIAPYGAVRHAVDVFTSASYVEFHTVESSHLGMLTGEDAQRYTWPAIKAFRERLDAERL
ncbi:MAG: alpha/beta hydrolase [Gordonia sp. (in: high G+C Gram-positive bacteria)]